MGSSSKEGEADGGGDSFVLRSGIRAGLKREFAFAIASQAALPSSSAPLGRTRRSWIRDQGSGITV